MPQNTNGPEDRSIQKLIDVAGKAGFDSEANDVVNIIDRLDEIIDEHTATIDQLTTDLKAAQDDLKAAQDELKDAQAEVEKYKGQAAV